MAEQTPRYRFRGSIKPTAEVKRPVKAYRNVDSEGANGQKLTSATIDIFDVIDSWGGWWGLSAGEVDQALAKVGEVDTLYVRVNSPGGEATEGIAIANLLRAHAAAIRVTNYGLAASAASFIAIAGETLSMAPGSMLMVHKASNGIYGNADDLRAETAILDKFDESIASLYALKAGSDTDWLALMAAETWMTPDDAVEIGLADKVGIEPGPPPANPEDQAEPMPGDDGDTPFDRAARVFDLTIFEHAPAAFAAHKRPADPPAPPTKGAVAMTDEELTALREALGLPEDADAAAITAKAEELATAPDTGGPAEVTDETALAHLASMSGLKPEQVRDALDAAKAGKVAISPTLLDELKSNSAAGAEARKRQLDDERDAAVDKAISEGKVSRDRRDTWRTAWDKDPEGTAKDLGELEARFPVSKPTGFAGSDGSDGAAPFTDDEAAALAQLSGTSKEALVNG